MCTEHRDFAILQDLNHECRRLKSICLKLMKSGFDFNYSTSCRSSKLSWRTTSLMISYVVETPMYRLQPIRVCAWRRQKRRQASTYEYKEEFNVYTSLVSFPRISSDFGLEVIARAAAAAAGYVMVVFVVAGKRRYKYVVDDIVWPVIPVWNLPAASYYFKNW